MTDRCLDDCVGKCSHCTVSYCPCSICLCWILASESQPTFKEATTSLFRSQWTKNGKSQTAKRNMRQYEGHRLRPQESQRGDGTSDGRFAKKRLDSIQLSTTPIHTCMHVFILASSVDSSVKL